MDKRDEFKIDPNPFLTKAIREQRRYEIARDCAAAIAGNNYEREAAVCIADYAISIADALLAELDKEPTP